MIKYVLITLYKVIVLHWRNQPLKLAYTHTLRVKY